MARGSTGRVTSLAELAAATGRTVGDVLPAVATAVAAGALDADGGELRWSSPAAEAATVEALRAGGPPGSDAAGWLRRSAAHLTVASPGAAVGLLQAALPLAREDDRPALVLDLGRALHAAGRWEEAAELCRQALGGRDASLEPVALDLRRILVLSLAARGLIDEAAAEAAATAPAGPGRPRAWALAAQALPLLLEERAAEAGTRAAAARVAAAEAGDGPAQVLALTVAVRAAWGGGRMEEATELGAELVRASRHLRPDDLPEARCVAAIALSGVDRHAEALELLRGATSLAVGTGRPGATLVAHACTGAVLAQLGALDRAAEELRAAAAGTDAAWSVDVQTLLAVVQAPRGAHDEAVAALAQAEALVERGLPVWTPGALASAGAEVALAAGDEDRAAELLRRAWAAPHAASPQAARRIGAMIVHLLGATDPEAAGVAAVLGEVAAATPGVPSLAGVAAWAAGLVAGDAPAVRAAHERLRRTGRVVLAARCGLDAARLLEDRRQAAALGAEVLAELGRVGAHGEAVRGAALLRAAGIAVAPGRAGGGVGWGALTPTERRVATLVAAGLSNPEVATRLYVSVRTVSTHVSHVLHKLGLRSRTELAVWVARTPEPAGGSDGAAPDGG